MTEFHAGDLIGDYRLEARLGHGGFGTVWRARHVNTGRVVAVKVLPENDNLQDSASLRADVELLAASAASASPHIVQVLGGGIDPVPYVVMEFVNGSSLAEDLKARGKLTQQEVIEIGLGIAEALEALQAVGIVHRDVKPSNVLIDKSGTVKLSDFGIAKIAGYDAVTVTGQLPLSISYAAPEVWEGKAEHRSDLYALGVLLYQCLCGSLPFRGAYAELFYQHRSTAPDLAALPPGTAQSLHDLISICLRKDPGERPEGAATCKELLLQAKDEIETAAEDEVPLVEPSKFGSWIKGEPNPQQAWAWYATNPETGQDAVVELHFAASAAYGEALRKAVAENLRLTPLGAEQFIQTNRLILRPGEAWADPPPGQFQFWVARDEIALPESPEIVGAATLLGYVESLQALIAEGRQAEIALEINSDNLFLLADGSVHLRRPGLAVDYEGDADRDALEYLKTRQLTREVRPLVSRATNLDDLRVSLERLQTLAAAPAGGNGGRIGRGDRLRLAGAAFVMTAIIAVTAVAGVLLMQDDETTKPDEVIAPSPTLVPPPPIAAACLALDLPVTLEVAEATCTQGAVLRFMESCPTGVACRRDPLDGVVSVGVDDRTVALIDASGKLSLGRENGQEQVPLSADGNVEAADWSPDGTYLAYVTSQPVASTTPGSEPATSTQLRIVEAGRPANDGVVLATNNIKERTQEGLQRLITSPQWSPDGKLLYFLWSIPTTPGDEVFAVEVPRSASGEIEFGRLRSGIRPDETRLDFPMAVVAVKASDFGVAGGYINNLKVADDGALILQICQGTTAMRMCGIGRWDGAATLLLPIEQGLVYGLPVASPFDGALHVPVLDAGVWNLYRIDGAYLVLLPNIQFPTATTGAAPVFTFNRKGDHLLIETAAGQMSLVGYGTGIVTPWGPGTRPLWFVAKPAEAAPVSVPTPPAVAYATPAATPTPTATATAQPAQQMALLVTVLRNNNTVSGARVTATVNGETCATVVTATGSATMTFPAPNAPIGCRQTGANIRFVVDGVALATPVAEYRPGASLPFELRLP